MGHGGGTGRRRVGRRRRWYWPSKSRKPRAMAKRNTAVRVGMPKARTSGSAAMTAMRASARSSRSWVNRSCVGVFVGFIASS